VTILDGPEVEARRARDTQSLTEGLAEEVTELEALGVEALAMRNSEAFRAAKRARPYEGMSWDLEGVERTADDPPPLHPEDHSDAEEEVPEGDGESDVQEAPEPPLASRMSGRIAVARIYVSGPEQRLRFTQSEKVRIEADVQEGLSLLGSRSPARDVTFVHNVRDVEVAVPEVPSGNDYEVFEKPWRDAALPLIGVEPGPAGVRHYSRELRRQLDADWAYMAFITKYRLHHFAYTRFALSMKWVVMIFPFSGWRDSLDRIFAHETGHVFGAPDEYGQCNCGGSHGHFGRPNSNCERCAPGGGVRCLMGQNVQGMCTETLYHLGYEGLPPLMGPVA
jgi:hypothetical protein